MATKPLPDLTLAETAHQLNCSERTVRRMVADGELKAYRVGKRLVRIRATDLDDARRAIPSGGAA